MSYDFTPMTDEELNKSDLMEDGIYNFEIYKSERKPSAAGNAMAKLSLKVWDNNNTVHFVNGFLVFSDSKFTMKIVKHFCESVGLEKEYEQGKIPEELEHYCGKADIRTEKGKPIPEDRLNGKSFGTCYPDRNIVFDYIPKSESISVKNDSIREEDLFQDVIPF